MRYLVKIEVVRMQLFDEAQMRMDTSVEIETEPVTISHNWRDVVGDRVASVLKTFEERVGKR